MVLIILYNFSYLYDTLSLGSPFTGVWASYQTINVLGQFSTAVVDLTWCRAPIPRRLFAAAFSASTTGGMKPRRAGLPAWRRTLRIILPQALRTILPSGFNRIIGLAKGTAMVYVLAMPELFYTIR